MRMRHQSGVGNEPTGADKHADADGNEDQRGERQCELAASALLHRHPGCVMEEAGAVLRQLSDQ
ncbi:hypothetical protein D3C81_1329360 [compost metagenome]